MVSRRRFFGALGVVAGVTGVSGLSEIRLEIKPGNVASLKPPFRLPVEWYRATVARFQAKLA